MNGKSGHIRLSPLLFLQETYLHKGTL